MSLLPLLAGPERAHSYCHDHLLLILAVIAGVAIIAALRDVLFHDGSHSHRQPPTSHYPDRFDPRFIA